MNSPAPPIDQLERDLVAAIVAAGMPAPTKSIQHGGKFNRWGDARNGKKPYWLSSHVMSSGHIAATFGDWRTGLSSTYRTWENGTPTDPNEAQRLLDELARRQKAADAEAAATKAATAKREAEIWEMLPEIGTSEYLARKRVGAYGIRYGSDHRGKFIAVPMRTIASKFTGFQRIYADEFKHFPTGVEKKGAFHQIGSIDSGGVLYLVEGYATGATVHEATGAPVLVCFDAGNMAAVAAAIKDFFPDLALIVAADSDQWKAAELDPQGKPKGNTGVRKAYAVARAHPGIRVAIPSFDNLDTSSEPTDWNDLAALTSLDNVRHQMKKAFIPKEKDSPQAEAPAGTDAVGTYSLIEGTGKSIGLMRPSKAAKVLAQYQKDAIAYDITARTWLKYTGTHWTELNDDAVFTMVDILIDGGVGDFGYGPDYVRGTIDLLRSRLCVDQFDTSPNLVPFLNGVLDLKTRELHPHAPGFHLTWCLPFNYDPAATCEPVKEWLLECVKGDSLQVELLRAYLKAILTGRSDFQRYLELIGPGGGGKGTFTRLAEAIVGSQHTHVTSLKRLETNRFETSQLYKKRLCLITDSERYAGEVSMFKAMTGQDTLPNEQKHKQHGEPFRFNGMVIVAGNENIGSADLTSGFQRRRITVRFDNPVAAGLRRDLEEEFLPLLPGVVTWCLSMDDERMRQLLVETTAYIPTLAKVAMDTLINTNPLAAWALEYLVADSKAETPIGRLEKSTISKLDETDADSRKTVTRYEHTEDWLYPSYYRYCEQNGNKAVAARRFTDLLTDLLCHQLKLTGIEYLPKVGSALSRFKGIRLRAENEPDGGLWTDSKDSKRQQKDSKKTANGEYKTARQQESKSVNGDACRENADKNENAAQDNKTASDCRFTGSFARNTEESDTYGKICRPFAVNLPDFTGQQADFAGQQTAPSTWSGPCYKCGWSAEATTGGLWCKVLQRSMPPGATSTGMQCQSYRTRGLNAVERIDPPAQLAGGKQ